jgi:phosphatidylglycerophosphatase A
VARSEPVSDARILGEAIATPTPAAGPEPGVPPPPATDPARDVSAPGKATFAFMRGHASRWIALGFGSGLAPFAPGTVGTLWAWAVFLLLDPWLGPIGWSVLIGWALGIGVWACTRTAQALAVADPSAIVWDEIVAFWIVLWLVMPAGLFGQAIAFGLFRFFDAAKPGPVGWVDRRFKRARGWRQGVGILADDLVAALATLLVIALWRFIFP